MNTKLIFRRFLFVLFLWLGLFLACGDDDEEEALNDLSWETSSSSTAMNWVAAGAYCQTLSDEEQKEWRLPTINELRSLIDGCAATELAGECGATDLCQQEGCADPSCAGCDSLRGPGPNGVYWPNGLTGEIGSYWSSSQLENAGMVWSVNFAGGSVIANDVDSSLYVRCVCK